MFFQGAPQWIEILFNDTVTVKGFEFQFQGGFVGQKCSFSFYKKQPRGDDLPELEFQDFYPEDTNCVQTCTLGTPVEAKFIRLVFNESTDFYGRVILYRLTVLWWRVEDPWLSKITDHFLGRKSLAFVEAEEHFIHA